MAGQAFDGDWKFRLGEAEGAEDPAFGDEGWREVDLPHDWSIETLPGQESGKVVGHFSRDSIGTTATGYAVGGTGWYRKTFVLDPREAFDRTIVAFDGVYMDCEIWVNGRRAGGHPNGYTAFSIDISPYLHEPGKPNTIAVKVRNEGKNSRWYSGSGIYRHAWLLRSKGASIVRDGACVETERLDRDLAVVKIRARLEKNLARAAEVALRLEIFDPDGKVVYEGGGRPKAMALAAEDREFAVEVPAPRAWSVEEPKLYTARLKAFADGVESDEAEIRFGIRTIGFSARDGFLLNGKSVKLRGGCLHHDNGFLGSAAIDGAEERRVRLMKANGFNAVRASHNPPSTRFLDACDRLGMLVIDEAFDMWERPKNPEDYHRFFREWREKDLESMVNRDRNHPCVIMWSIGNEINERAETEGVAIRKGLAAYVRKLDPSRPVTEAICDFWDHPGQAWETTIPAYADLDVGGYNYLDKRYEADHERFPGRIMVGTESYPAEAHAYWRLVEKHPYVIGDFVWTAMDYLGENGCGNASYGPEPGPRVGLKPWPWFNAFCGDIDLCGCKKPQSHYRDVAWDRSPIELMVHAPVPAGMVETCSYWGWPDECRSWNWKGQEGRPMEVRAFTKCQAVRLELNGRAIDERAVPEGGELGRGLPRPLRAGQPAGDRLERRHRGRPRRAEDRGRCGARASGPRQGANGRGSKRALLRHGGNRGRRGRPRARRGPAPAPVGFRRGRAGRLRERLSDRYGKLQ